MKAKDGVIDLLNASLTIELTAINQYFLAARQCEAWGFPALQKLFRGLAMDEMKDTEELMDHILYLEGLPNMQRLNTVRVGQTVPELFDAGLALELGAVEHLRTAIAHCAQVGDFTTRSMFEEMIRDEEEHVDLFETQMDAVRAVGLERYLAQQLREPEAD
jgi:bacterioferritin